MRRFQLVFGDGRVIGLGVEWGNGVCAMQSHKGPGIWRSVEALRKDPAHSGRGRDAHVEWLDAEHFDPHPSPPTVARAGGKR